MKSDNYDIEPAVNLPSSQGIPLEGSSDEKSTFPSDIDPRVITIEWSDDDPQNPRNWSKSRKYILLCTAFITTSLCAANVTHIAIVTPAGEAHFGVSRDAFTLAVMLPMLSIALTPLVLAPLSETLGRNMIYQVSGVLSLLLYLPQIFTTNFHGFLAARWFQGMAQSVANSMTSGTVADMFGSDDRGRPMSMFTLATFFGQSLGGCVFGWVVQYLDFRWVYIIQAIINALACVLNLCFLRETRSDILLQRRAARLTKETGIKHICAGGAKKGGALSSIAVSCLRPIKFLFTEPIVSALSTWIGFAWAMIFLGGTSVTLVFLQYGWSRGELGMAQLPIFLGGCLGFMAADHQEYLYRRAAKKHGGVAPPEARLYYAAYGGLCFPLAMFVFAWTGRPDIPWPIPAIALVFANFGIFSIYAGVFNYLADAYETYSSSAQAAQSLARNILGAVFPLFTYQFYTSVGYPEATTIVAAVALFLGLAPFILLRYGGDLRARSKVASSLRPGI